MVLQPQQDNITLSEMKIKLNQCLKKNDLAMIAQWLKMIGQWLKMTKNDWTMIFQWQISLQWLFDHFAMILQWLKWLDSPIAMSIGHF